ncbi:MAG: alpha-L-fucosidase [Terracidiphilus sp.]
MICDLRTPVGTAYFAIVVCVGTAGAVVHAQGAATIAFNDRTVLMGADAATSGTLKAIDMRAGKVGWVESWSSSDDSLTWKPRVQQSGDYEIAAILESSGKDCRLRILVDQQSAETECGEHGWTRAHFGTMHLNAGEHTIKVTSIGAKPPAKFFSLEFVRPQTSKELAAAGRRQMADTSWMVSAEYGLMFHWTSQSKPEHGPPLSYCDAVRSFDADRFADAVAETGAGFIVFTTSHAEFYFPGPNPVIDEVLPGRTCPRDLVADLVRALGRHNIRLELYFHPGHDDAPWWERTHFNDDKRAYFQLWRRIIAQIGKQYGAGLAGFWFDDGAFTYYPFNPSWQEMTAAARTGNPNRVIVYNSWILPKLNDFYDVYGGENAFWESQYEELVYLPVGGTGRFTGGPQEGLQAEMLALLNDDWGHFKVDTPIGPPRITADKLIEKLRDAISRKEVLVLDAEVYQDGTMSPATLQLLRTVRNEMRPSGPQSAGRAATGKSH